MDYSFPRRKIFSAPKIPVTTKYLAEGSLKKSYTDTKIILILLDELGSILVFLKMIDETNKLYH